MDSKGCNLIATDDGLAFGVRYWICIRMGTGLRYGGNHLV